MSLTSALSIAQSALFATSRQTSTISRNVAEARNADYTRRTLVQTHQAPGVGATQVHRATNAALFKHNLLAISSYEGQSALRAGADRLALAVNGVDNASSAATALGNLQKAMQLFSSAPSNRTLAEGAVEAGRQTVRALNDGTRAIQTIRTEADADIASAVSELNQLLKDFDTTNTEIIKGTRSGREVANELDQRDALLKKISQYVPVSAYTRENNDMVVMTGDGAMLYETSPRAVTFQPTNAYGAGTTGNAIHIDGVALTAGSGGNTTSSGKLAGLVQLRDDVAVQMQSQLDEVARGLINAFRETAAANPDRPGLFTWPGAPAMPAAGAAIPGLAGQISVNAAMDSTAGGNPFVLRDGGANGAAYVANAGGDASFSDLLLTYGDRLDQPFAFDVSTGISTGISVSAYSAAAIGWVEAQRQQAANGEETKTALLTRTAESLSNITGVNVDEEMALLLDLEQSYEASARLIKAVDDMLNALMAAMR